MYAAQTERPGFFFYPPKTVSDNIFFCFFFVGFGSFADRGPIRLSHPDDLRGGDRALLKVPRGRKLGRRDGPLREARSNARCNTEGAPPPQLEVLRPTTPP